MNAQNREYKPVRCWKCGQTSNFAETGSCRYCGVFLKSSLSAGEFRKPRQSEQMILRLLAVVAVAGIVFAGAAYTVKSIRAESPAADGATVPADAWFSSSPLNLYKPHPTVDQILQKYESVSNGSIAADEIVSSRMTGTVSLAIGDCVAEQCRREPEKIAIMKRGLLIAAGKRDPSTLDEKFVQSQRVLAHYENRGNEESGEIELSDKWTRPYVELGEMTVVAKRPDSTLATTKIKDVEGKGGWNQTTEVFNGLLAWKREVKLDSEGKEIEKIEKDLDEKATAEMKLRSLRLWDRSFNSSQMKYTGLSKVNDRVCYVLSEKGASALSVEKFYFDAITGYLIKSEVDAFTIYFDNYKNLGGLVVPATIYYRNIEIGGFQSWTRLEIGDWSFNGTIDDTIFSRTIK